MPDVPFTENQLDKAITDYLRVVLPPEVVCYHNVSGGFKLSPHEIGKLKRSGWLPGVPDRILLHKGKAFYLETKRPGGRLSPSQREMIERLRLAGCPTEVVYSLNEVANALAKWDIPTRSTLLL